MLQAYRDSGPAQVPYGTVDLGPVAQAKAARDTAEMGLLAQRDTNRTQLDAAKLQIQNDNYKADLSYRLAREGMLRDDDFRNLTTRESINFAHMMYGDFITREDKASEEEIRRYNNGQEWRDKEWTQKKVDTVLGLKMILLGTRYGLQEKGLLDPEIPKGYSSYQQMLENHGKTGEQIDTYINTFKEGAKGMTAGAFGQSAFTLFNELNQKSGLKEATGSEAISSNPEEVRAGVEAWVKGGKATPEAVHMMTALSESVVDSGAEVLKDLGLSQQDYEFIAKFLVVKDSVRPGLKSVALSGEDWDGIVNKVLSQPGRELRKGKGRELAARKDAVRLVGMAKEVIPAIEAMQVAKAMSLALRNTDMSGNLDANQRGIIREGVARKDKNSLLDIQLGMKDRIFNESFDIDFEGMTKYLDAYLAKLSETSENPAVRTRFGKGVRQ